LPSKRRLQIAEKAFNDKSLNQLADKNHVKFLKSQRRRFCSNNIRPASCINDCNGDKSILQEFTNYLELVGQPNSVNAADLEYSEEVEKLLSDCTALSSIESMFVELNELQECISKLKPGNDISFKSIYNEHIIYGCAHLFVHLCLLFNVLLRHGIVPTDFGVGVIIPLLKNKHGDHSNLHMHRGATVAPANAKLFESILLQLYGSYLVSDTLQLEFKKNSSCSIALFTFTEANKYCNNLRSKIYCALLDASKAFGKVLHTGNCLFLKLINRNVPTGFVRISKVQQNIDKIGKCNKCQ